MEQDAFDPDAAAFFSTQLMLYAMQNLIYAGVYDPNHARTHVQEVLDHGLTSLRPDQRMPLSATASVFLEMIDTAEAQIWGEAP